MTELSDDQNNYLATFCEITGSEITNARTILESVNWNLESAVTLFYEEQNINGNDIQFSDPINNNLEQVNEINNSDGIRTDINIENINEGNSTKINKYLRIFLTLCGASLNTFFGFLKTIFCIPNINDRIEENIIRRNVSGSSLNRHEVSHLEEVRRIRQEQDLEYLKSLNADSIKQERALKKRHTKELIKERRENLMKDFNNEKEIEKEFCSRICVRNLAGKRFQRNFHKDDLVYEIYKWIDSLALDETNLISDKFSLRLPHSKSIEIDDSYKDNTITIEEIGFFPSALLLINNFDDESE